MCGSSVSKTSSERSVRVSDILSPKMCIRDRYRDQLSEIGNHEKDNTYMVDLDPEGKLEVY